MSKIKDYLSLVTFNHTIFAMPFAILGVALGLQELTHPMENTEIISKLILVILCMVFARSAAMGFNRYLDADIDAKNDRTKNREIPAGIISRRRALSFIILMSVGFLVTTYLINPLCFYLSPIALFVVLFYSYTKRFTSLCHLVLGVGLGLAPIGAYMAVTETINIPMVELGLAVLFWVAGFDIIYSMQDREFDASEKLHSIPVALGLKNSILLARILHSLSAILLFFTLRHFFEPLNYFAIAAYLVFVSLLVFQHQLFTDTDFSRINKKFMTTNGYASLIFSVLCIFGIWYQ